MRHIEKGIIRENQCVFIKGFRSKRIHSSISLTAAAELPPNDPGKRRADETHSTGVSDVSSLPAMRADRDVSLPVSRPAHRGTRLSRGGWSLSFLGDFGSNQYLPKEMRRRLPGRDCSHRP